MVRAKRIYILIIKVNKLFSLLSSRCLPKEIENMFSVFLSSCRNTRESLGLQLPACSHSISGSLWPKQLCNTCFAMCYGKVLRHPHVTFVWISLGHSKFGTEIESNADFEQICHQEKPTASILSKICWSSRLVCGMFKSKSPKKENIQVVVRCR